MDEYCAWEERPRTRRMTSVDELLFFKRPKYHIKDGGRAKGAEIPEIVEML